MFSHETAIEFLKSNLRIDDVREKLLNRKLELLNNIIQAFYQKIPFNNFSVLAADAQKRACPPLEQMLYQIRTGSGGVCNALNTVCKHLLDALGYRTEFGWGQIMNCIVRDPHHMMILVHDVEQEGDIYYTDVGIGFPTFEAVPLNDLPRIYKFAFHSCKFENGEDGKFVRYHRKNAVMGVMADDDSELWEPFIVLSREPKAYSEYQNAMDEIYTCQDGSVFLNIVYAAFYPDGNAVTLRDLTLRLWNKETQMVEVLAFETVQDAFETIAKQFYTVDKGVIKQGLDNWAKTKSVGKDTRAMV